MRTLKWIRLLVVLSVVPVFSALGQGDPFRLTAVVTHPSTIAQALPAPLHIHKEDYPSGNKSPLGFSPDGTRIVFPMQITDLSNSGETGVADAASGTLLYQVKGDLVSLVSPDNRIVTFDASTGSGQFMYWDISSPQAAQQLNSFGISNQFDAGLDWLYVALDFHSFVTTNGNDTINMLWDLTTGKEITSPSKPILPGGEGYPSYSPDASLLAIHNTKGTLSVFDTGTWNELYQLSVPGGIQTFKFSPDSKSLVTGNTDQTVTLWNSATGQSIETFTPGVHPNLLAVTDDRANIAVASVYDGKVVLWNTLSRQPVLNLSVGAVTEIALDKDATHLATWPNQGDLLIWNLTPGQELLPPTTEPTPGQ